MVSLPFLLTPPVTVVLLDKVSSYMCICLWVKCAFLNVYTNMYRVRINSIAEKNYIRQLHFCIKSRMYVLNANLEALL